MSFRKAVRAVSSWVVRALGLVKSGLLESVCSIIEFPFFGSAARGYLVKSASFRYFQ